MGIGRLKLAGLVQYIPMPVIGGYLAFIGYFCCQAGIGMMVGVDIKSIDIFYHTFMEPMKLFLVLPGIFSGIMIYCMLPIIKSPITLPVCLFIMLVIFYSVLYMSGLTLQNARDSGWISALTTNSSPRVFDLFNFEKTNFNMVPKQIGRWLAMVIVVGFSSCLDMAAIEMESTKPLDYNQELQTVGWSNVFSGLAGGYTGSYIFTQTIFSLRSGVQTRLCGLFVILIEAAVVMMPVPITCFVPKFVFGSLLIFIALDLLVEWLVYSYKKMSSLEYVVCVVTFISMLFFGVQMGLLCGLISAMFMFVVAYASKPAVSISNLQQSRVQRSYHERCLLIAHRGNIVSIHPKGYVFFGTAIKIVDEIKRHTLFGASGKSLLLSASRTKNNYGSLSQNITLTLDNLKNNNTDTFSDNCDSTEFVVMDFSAVVGVDATAARSCFLLLTRLLRSSQVRVVFTGMTRDIERLLRSNGVLDECVVFPEADDALEWCEENVLARLRFEEGWEETFKSYTSGECEVETEPLRQSSPPCPASPLDYDEYSKSLTRYSNAHMERQARGSVKSSGSFYGDSNHASVTNRKALSPIASRDDDSRHGAGAGAGVSLLSSVHDHEYVVDLSMASAAMTTTNGNGASAPSPVPGISRSRSTSRSTCNNFVSSMKGSMSHDDLTNLRPPTSKLRMIFDEHLEKSDHHSQPFTESLGLKLDDYDKDKINNSNNSNSGNNNNKTDSDKDSDIIASMAILEKYFTYKNLSRGRILFDAGSQPKRLFVIAHGAVEVVTRKFGTSSSSSSSQGGVLSSTSIGTALSSSATNGNNNGGVTIERVYKMSAGSIVGEAEFLLQKPYTTRCFAATAVGLWVLDLEAYGAMARDHPALYHELQEVLLKSLSIANMTGIFHLHPSSTYHIGAFLKGTNTNTNTNVQSAAIYNSNTNPSTNPLASERFKYIYDKVEMQ